MFISVLLPDPEGPMMATNSPRRTSRSAPRRACTVVSPSSYTFVTPRIRITGGSAASTTGCRSRSLIRSAPSAPGRGAEIAAPVLGALTLGPPGGRGPAEDHVAAARITSPRHGRPRGRGGQHDFVALFEAGDHLGVLVVGQADLNRAR